jgi:hypothetical protein
VSPSRALHRAALALGLVLLSSCSSSPRAETGASPGRGGSHVELSGRDISGASSVLEGVAARLANVDVTRPRGGCPQVVFRGARSFQRPGTPQVYVDGTPVLNTCALDQIRVNQVSHIQIFSGSGAPAGYRSSPHGTILVFLTNG